MSRTADVLGVERSNLYRKMKAFGIAPSRRPDGDEEAAAARAGGGGSVLGSSLCYNRRGVLRMSSDPLRTDPPNRSAGPDAQRTLDAASRRGSRCPNRTAAARRPRPLLRRPLRTRHQRLDARAVFRSQSCPRAGVHRIVRAARSPSGSARPRSSCTAARPRSAAGDAGEARRLLQAAIDGGAPLEDAFPMLERLNRMEPAPAAPPQMRVAGGASCGPGDARRARPGPSRRRARGVAR